MAKISVVHGPNLNLLGTREPEIYGHETLADIDRSLKNLAVVLGHSLESFQSNHEGVLVDHLQGHMGKTDALILNAAAYTHTSIAIRDAVLALQSKEIRVIEVHLSNPHKREAFRAQNYLQDIVDGRIEGFGGTSYLLALRAASALIAPRGDV